MANLSQQKRLRMLKFLQTIREEHKDDDTYVSTDDGYFHSKCLSFMAERLHSAKLLLSSGCR